jgi:(1->4)-alpha-D-glucan 1-alpha-D-glucosylmutase
MQARLGDAASGARRQGTGRLLSETYTRFKESLAERRHIPAATYRLQFNRFFTFRDARKLVDYLQMLGVSDVYASPYFKARSASLHGYDIVNHNELNSSIGSEEEYDAFVAELHRQGMGQVLDIVPNHMGIGEETNTWWTDVLENGRSSLNAPYFDIDWEPLNTKLIYKVLLPVLGEQYGRVLEKGELQVDFLPGEGRFVLRYWDNTFPLDPRSYEDILNIDKERLLEELGPESEDAVEYQSILTAIGHLPAHSDTDRERAQERSREKEVIKRRLAALVAKEPQVLESIGRAVKELNGKAGDPRSFDRLDALLERQPYRLSLWRVATEEINYRRFFDVNELVAIQVDRQEVFQATHRTIMRLLCEGKLDGLRIDHVDGLRDPAGYMQMVQRAYFTEICRSVLDDNSEHVKDEERAELEQALLARFDEERAEMHDDLLYKPLYMVVEKILGRGEELPAAWPVYGTTGYEFTNAVNGLFVDSANQRTMDEIYRSFIGDKINFAELVYESKQVIMRISLSSEVNMLTNMLVRITEGDRHYRDFTVSVLRNAIREVIASFPVYRTYLTPDLAGPDKRDRGIIEAAVSRARRRNPAADPSVFDFLRDVLLQQRTEGLSEQALQARWDFVMKFQQVTGPVTAKGIEDTAFYIYGRLVSLNEVGGEPDLFGISPAQFHQAQLKRLQSRPHSMLTTSTHDTKRGEDVRARINVLSEMPGEWRAALRRWARLNRKHKRKVEGQPAPDANEEHFLYQTLLGVWPFKSELTTDEHIELVERVQQYMRKALNEAKVHTSWVNTNEEYLSAVSDFVADILRDSENLFLVDFLPFQRRIARFGAFNSLSQVLLKLTSPGVPDIYQGTELWDLSLVDPDNRRPVNYRLRRRLLAQTDRVRDAKGAARLLDSLEDGRVKLLITSRALRFRREHRELFDHGDYVPLEATGKLADSVVAFARSWRPIGAHPKGAPYPANPSGRIVVVVAPRLITRIAGAQGTEAATPTRQAWSGSHLVLPPGIDLPAGARFRNVFTGELLEAHREDGTSRLALDEAFATLPVALLEIE